MALTRANNAPNSILLTPYINIDGQAISLGSSINLLTTPNLTLNPSSGGIYFKTNSTQRMFIDNSGNIAVNISAPNIRSSPTGQYLTIGGTGAAGGVLELVNTNSDANNNYSTIVFAANANDQAINKSIAQVEAFTSGTTNYNRGGTLIFSTKSDGLSYPIERFRIDGYGSSQFSGSQIVETATVSGTAAATTVTYDVMTNKNILYYTGAATANWTFNVRGSATVSLNTLMSTGQSLTVVFLNTNTASAFYPTAFQIDGSAVTPKWQGGTAPSSGNANSIDSYSYTIIKTASATYTVLASQTRFA